MSIAKLERIKARSLKQGDKLIVTSTVGPNQFYANKVVSVTPAKAKLAAGERQTPSHRMKIQTISRRLQVLPSADVFIMPRVVAKKRGQPRTRKAL